MIRMNLTVSFFKIEERVMRKELQEDVPLILDAKIPTGSTRVLLTS